ncbi:MAG TPA: 8-oxoguanine deaminase [Pseudonocardia sp.]|jgi:cytosine/adenosine deaminase-related metal-dependent hydrolase|nr:8-oxoguanine deaminase [Pseudonocardia sp.]
MSSTVISGAHVVTMDAGRAEYRSGHVVVDGNRIVGAGSGPAPHVEGARVVDGRGCLLTPGLVNTHQHLYQWATRGLAVDSTLFEWLTRLYPVWAAIDEKVVNVAGRAALAWLARSGCTTTTDHHYVFPKGGGDLLAAEIEAARTVGLRFHPCRGSMDRGRSAGGLPPDEVVEDRDAVLTASADAVDRWHDPAPGSMLRIALAPCSPFSVTAELMRESAELARKRKLRLHTHLAETIDEQDYCRERFGRTPLEYVEELGWIGEDVWFAHAVHLDDASIQRVGATRTGVAHCPASNARLGAGIARTRELRDAGTPVGLGVDGAASNESGSLIDSARQALLFARARGGPSAMTVREALELATLGGASVLGRADEIGSIEPGKLADLALWRIDGLGHADVEDPVAALLLGTAPPLELLLVNGSPIVEGGRVTTVDEESLAGEVTSVHRELLQKVG